ncbi:flagellar export protein FliJ [Treponema sp.]|uniref:flagellar export protein FliJ n=1 Tax=Treponema sp. TaxID=166 RepID=UPI0025FFF58A|nr:flagellar export protein FliJ [Treponema sp.]MCR5219297.1 flagellar export protein FliJ [Treponema sp.]
MKKFEFSMEKILELRRFEQKEAESELGKINSQIAALQNQLKEMAASHNQVVEQGRGCKDFAFISQSQQYFAFLDQKKEEIFKEIAELEIIADQRRQVVKEAMQKVKVLEKLREKKLNQWKDDVLKEEEAETEDIVNSRYDSDK